MIDKSIISESYYRFLNIPSGDLRISVTNACNMKCIYCHNEGQSSNTKKYLSLNDIVYIVERTKKYGLTKVRLTGGDPLVHPDILNICRVLKHNLNINNLGLNTNGYRSDLLVQICKEGLLDQVVIGMDTFEGDISKKSPIGPSCNNIKDLVLKLKERGVNVQIATVYKDNLEDIYSFVNWALKNGILLKILEEENYENPSFDSNRFDSLVLDVKEKYNLKAGITADLRELYLFNEDGKILFFQSHCNRGECHYCRNMHLRVNSEGKAKPCMFKDETYDLLDQDFDLNMKKAIANMGISPNESSI